MVDVAPAVGSLLAVEADTVASSRSLHAASATSSAAAASIGRNPCRRRDEIAMSGSVDVTTGECRHGSPCP